MKFETKKDLKDYINNLKGYQGYVQFSHRPIDKSKDIFLKNSPQILDEDGFVYEAHFSNDKESISIKQINEGWLVSVTDISNISDTDIQEFITYIEKLPKVKMAQVWEEVEDEFCENMKVKKLSKIVFAGFEGDEK